MANKKPSGLGRGLGELLYDNTPDIIEGRGSASIRKEGESIRITPAGSTTVTTKSLFETKHKNKSVKSNFKK